MRNSSVELSTRWYMMQPGDGTRYVFGIGSCEGAGSVISGICSGEDYVIVQIMMGGSGVGVLYKWGLSEDQLHYAFGYAKRHGFDAVDNYTLAAVLLAATVLIDHPGDFTGASEAMLKAPMLLEKVGL